MKKNTGVRFFGGALMAVVLCLYGCSDGVLALPKAKGTNPSESQSLPPPVIKSFTADQMTLDHGGPVTLSWDISDADSIEITSDDPSNSFHYAPATPELKGSTTVTVEKTTVFTLKAVKKVSHAQKPPIPPQPRGTKKASGVNTPAPAAPTTPTPPPPPTDTDPTSVQTVKVTVNSPTTLQIKEFYAEAKNKNSDGAYLLNPGDQTVLHWTVLPADAKVTLTASTGEQPVAGDCAAPTTKAMEAAGDAAPAALPAAGCATVTPSEDTIYTINATFGTDSQNQKLSVLVGNAPTIKFNRPGPDKLGNIVLSWQASPKDAKVTVTASPALPDSVALPKDQALDANGQGSVVIPYKLITQLTTFTATVTAEGKTAQDTMVVPPAGGGIAAAPDCSQFTVAANVSAPVFVGEIINLYSNAPQGTSLHIADVNGNTVADGNGATMSVPAVVGGYNVSLQQQDGKTLCTKPVSVPVVKLKSLSNTKAVRVATDGKDPKSAYVGLDNGDFKCTFTTSIAGRITKTKIDCSKLGITHYQDSALDKLLDLDYWSLFTGFDKITKDFNPNFLSGFIKTFPVNAVVVSPSGRVFAATTGGIFYREGDSWKILDTVKRINSGNYPGSQPSCFGQTQGGKPNAPKGDLVALGQVCDLVADGDKLYMATDRDLLYLDNVENHIHDRNSGGWKGWGSPLHGNVVNDILVASVNGQNVVYAGASNGVFSSNDGGATWNPVGAIGSTVYAVGSFSNAGANQLVAGTANGIYVKDAASDTWKQSSDVTVATYGIATDPYSNSIYAGTAKGLYVSRDGGMSFKNVTGTSDKTVRSISVGYTADPTKGKPVDYAVYLATEQGVMNASLENMQITPFTPPVVQPLPGPVPGPTPVPNPSTAPTGTGMVVSQ